MNDPDDALVRQIAFSMISGTTLSTAKELCERAGGVDGFFSLPTRELWQRVGAQKVYCTDENRRALFERATAEASFIRKASVNVLPWTSAAYPTRLHMCDDAPALVYKLGKCDLNVPHMVAVVGTRRCTPYGARITHEIIEGLASLLPGTVIVSGLAYGVDIEAHRGALEAGLPTVAVMAHGLKTIYPAAHRDIAARIVRSDGAIITEYSSDTPVHRGNFLARNRIVAGMCDVTIVVESDTTGGAMVTASIAFDYGREVCAIPGRVIDRYSNGPNKLIATRRASLIRSAADLVELMNWTAAVANADEMPRLPIPELTPEMGVIAEHLRANPDATANSMAVSLGIPFHKLSARLMEMEMADVVSSLPGGRYELLV